MTKHKLPETLESLKQDYAKMKVSLDFAHVGISHISFDGDILWANRFYLDFIGFTEEELPGLNTRDFTRPEDLEKSLTTLAALRDGKVKDYEFDKIYLKRDGSYNWGHIQARLYKDEYGIPQYIVSVTHDINRRKEFENLLNLLLRTMPALVSYIDKELVYRYVNQTYEKWFGIPAKDIIGQKLIDIIGKEAFGEAEVHSKHVLRGEYVEYERRLHYRYGGARDVHVTFIPDFNPIGDVTGFVALVNDVTHIKANEEIPLDHHNRILESAKLTAFSAMASGLAHQLGKPLEGINSRLDQISEGGLSQIELQNEIDIIKQKTSRISKIIKGLKSFSRSETEDTFVEHNLALILEDAIAFCRERIASENVKIKVLKPKDRRVRCKPNQISQVILNLLNNSCDAISHFDEKWVEISVSDEPNRVLISIVDCGPGLSEDVVTELMSPFFTTKTKGSFAGLSLGHSRGIVENHGGKLFYDSSSPNTRFVIELPLSQKYVTI